MIFRTLFPDKIAKLERNLIFINILLYLSLTIFSYSYVDLNLTISQNPIVLSFVKTMQALGYYNRPAATFTYIFFLIIAFTFFILNLYLFKKSKLSLSYLKLSLISNTLILIFAYPFLSSDIFNYMFDSKIIANYHLSPYTNRALDFPNDNWIRFMRWVHRYSPYGPLWLAMSLIPYLVGIGKFITTLFAFKIFISLFHIANSFLVYKILDLKDPKNKLFGTYFYALNPVFLIEGIVNGHNDVVMATFLILPIYLLLKNKFKLSLFTLAIGTLTKYLSILALPLLLLIKFKKINFKKFIILNLILFSLFTFVYSTFGIKVPFVSSGSTQIQFQPWYLFWTIPFIALLPTGPLIIGAIVLSLSCALRYLPFLYYGNWSESGTIVYMQLITTVPLSLTLLFFTLQKLFKNAKN